MYHTLPLIRLHGSFCLGIIHKQTTRLFIRTRIMYIACHKQFLAILRTDSTCCYSSLCPLLILFTIHCHFWKVTDPKGIVRKTSLSSLMSSLFVTNYLVSYSSFSSKCQREDLGIYTIYTTLIIMKHFLPPLLLIHIFAISLGWIDLWSVLPFQINIL